MKKTAPASAGGERGEDDSGDAKDKEEASSSAAITEELHGFTSASEIYSVRSLQYTVHTVHTCNGLFILVYYSFR